MIPADAVLAMTGYHADTELLHRLGVPVDPVTGVPAHDEATHGHAGTGVLSGGSHCERKRCQPAVHRECPRSWRADRAAPAAIARRR